MNERKYRMWFFVGIFVGWLFFGEPTIRNSGIILLNSKQEVLLVQQGIQGLWGFPTYNCVEQNISYLQCSVKALEDTTSFSTDTDYIIFPGGCKYRRTLYFFGKLQGQSKTPGADTVQWFSVFELPKQRTHLVEDWIHDGMPISCGADDEL